MAHESFEDEQVAKLLNDGFVCVKVDREERPDVDSVYMNVCQMLTGSGGWPLSLFLTPEKKPFFAGTYFPKEAQHGRVGFVDLLEAVREQWGTNHTDVIQSSERIVEALTSDAKQRGTSEKKVEEGCYIALLQQAYQTLRAQYDQEYGGFGEAPKFPSPHVLLYLMKEKECGKSEEALEMVAKTLTHMYQGGIYDHIGYGFSRYSTDRYWLVPHFEKMLYDNALLMMAYSEAYQMTKDGLFSKVVERIHCYIKREMTSPEGAFYSAQDADSEGEEGKYYVFSMEEISELYGEEEGKRFADYYGMDENGNFEGKNIPNLLNLKRYDEEIERMAEWAYFYRTKRMELHKDDKILTAWNALMVAAYTDAYRVFKKEEYLSAAEKAIRFVEAHVWDGEKLYASYRGGRRSKEGFLDDYAFCILSYIKLYAVTFKEMYLNRADVLMKKAIADYFDDKEGGFYMTAKDAEGLIGRPKETYDGAMPSGNSVMAFNLLRLSGLLKDEALGRAFKKQNEFLAAKALRHPSASCFYLYALLDYLHPVKEVVCVLPETEREGGEVKEATDSLPSKAVVRVLWGGTKEYPLKNDKVTYYVCDGQACRPPVNEINKV